MKKIFKIKVIPAIMGNFCVCCDLEETPSGDSPATCVYAVVNSFAECAELFRTPGDYREEPMWDVSLWRKGQDKPLSCTFFLDTKDVYNTVIKKLQEYNREKNLTFMVCAKQKMWTYGYYFIDAKFYTENNERRLFTEGGPRHIWKTLRIELSTLSDVTEETRPTFIKARNIVERYYETLVRLK